MKFVILGDIGRDGLYHVGDEAMTEAAIEQLSCRGVTDITLVATDPAVASARYGLAAVERIGFTHQWQLAERDSVLDSLGSGDLPSASAAGRLSEAIAAADAVLIAGGGNMNSRFGHHIDERVALTRLAQRHDKPLFVTSQTIGPMLSPRERALTSEILAYATAVGTRDDESYHLAIELGAPKTRVHRTSDDALLLSAGEEQTVPDVAAEYGRYVIGSFTSDPGSSGLDHHEYLDQVAATMDELAGELDADVLLIPHVANLDGPVRKGDELSDRSIADRSRSGRIRAMEPMTTRQILLLTRGALLSVSTRYHPVVFGPALGVPSIGISLSHYSTVRMRGALAPIGLAPFLIPSNSWPQVLHAARDLIAGSAALRDWITSEITSRRQQQHSWWDDIAAARSPEAGAANTPRVLEQFPGVGPWAQAADRALASIDSLEAERDRGALLHEELTQSRATVRELQKELAAERATSHQLRQRAIRAESRRAVQLADRLGDGLRAITAATKQSKQSRQETPPVPPTQPAAPRPPLLSVIIPVYNVEAFLRECFDSVRAQTLTDLEVIVIDDGSTDTSGEIAQEYAEMDPRFKLHRQPNQGLGAVRNRALTLATGTFITFIDSDDVVPPSAFSSLVQSLEATRSDLAMGGVTRIQPDGALRTPQWVRDLHQRDYTTTLAQTPMLLRNYFTWNKVYRSDFWHAHGYQFREHVLFEDQPVITEILVQASSIDVVAQTTYLWRIRHDGSSLTDSMYSAANIPARHQAVTLTADMLRHVQADESIVHAWIWTLLEFHFPNYLKATADSVDDRRYAAVLEMITAVISAADVRNHEQVSAAHRLLTYLALTAPQERVRSYLAAGGDHGNNGRIGRIDGQVAVLLPFHDDDPPARPPADLYAVAAREQRLLAVLTGHQWDGDDRLIVSGRVGISQMPAGSELEIAVFLVSPDSHTRVPVPHTSTQLPAVPAPRPYGVSSWYELQAVINIPSLRHDWDQTLHAGVRIQFDVTSATGNWSGPFNRREQSSTAHELTGSALARSNETVALSWSRPTGLAVHLHARNVHGSNLRVDDGELSFDLDVRLSTFEIIFVLLMASGIPTRRFLVRRTSPHSYSARVDISWIEAGQEVALVAVDDRGRRRNIHGRPRPERLGAQLEVTTKPGAGLRLRRDVGAGARQVAPVASAVPEPSGGSLTSG